MTDEIYPYLVQESPNRGVTMRIAANITIPVSRDALKMLALNSVSMCIRVEDQHVAAVVVEDRLETAEEMTRRLMKEDEGDEEPVPPGPGYKKRKVAMKSAHTSGCNKRRAASPDQGCTCKPEII